MNRRNFLIGGLAIAAGCSSGETQKSTPDSPEDIVIDVDIWNGEGKLLSPKEVTVSREDMVRSVSMEIVNGRHRIKLAIERRSPPTA